MYLRQSDPYWRQPGHYWLIYLLSHNHLLNVVLGDKINAILKSANIDFVPAFLPGMFAKLLANDPRHLLMNLGNAPAQVQASATSQSAVAEVAKEVKEEKKAESSSESEADMGFGLFD